MRQLFPLLAAACWWLLSGCESGQRPDWEIYGELVGKETYHKSDFERCARLTDSDLRGDCTILVALELAESKKQPSGSYCQRAQDGTWQDECYFLAAERLRTQGKTKAAIKSCRASGQFASNCALHLWQRAVATLTRRYKNDPLTKLEAPARRMYTRWHKRVGDFSDFETRFWNRLFRQVWSPPGPVDPQRCEALSADLHEPCFESARLMLDQAIRAHIFGRTWAQRFCANDPTPAGELHTLLGSHRVLQRFSSHQSLDSLVRVFHESYCILGILPAPPEDPPPGPFPLNERPGAQHP